MPEPASSSSRLEQLRQRWEKDPASRLFLQLAEEYRRVGRLADAVAVLQEGLRRQPNYPSALVALGRCLLEQKEASAAAATLEKVLALDPTQLVANKLLIEAYLQLHEPAKARERLDLYSLLNDSDPEIGAFETRILKLEEQYWAPQVPLESEVGVAPASPPAGAASPSVTAPEPPPVPAPVEAPPVVPAVASARAAISREALPSVTPGVAGSNAWGEVFPLRSSATKAVDLDRIPSVASLRARPAGSASEPFGALARAADRARYLQALTGEGIFPAAPAAPPVEPSPAIPEPTPAAAAWEAAPPEPEVEIAPPVGELAVPAAPAFAAPTPAVEPPPPVLVATPPSPAFEPELPAPIAPPPPAAEAPVHLAAEARPAAGPTATLGELYLRQGHLHEAEAAFRAVLVGQPGHEAARTGLDETLRRRLEPLSAAELLRGVRSEELEEMGASARRAVMLKSYLERIRLRARHDVPPATQYDQ